MTEAEDAASATPLWRAGEAAAATGGRAEGWERVTGVSIDTREIAPGDLFVALKGEARDGHAFVAEALARGAGAAMVAHRPEGVGPEAPLLLVEDTLEGLNRLAAAARARTRARVLAVTGSVGKTTVKEMLRAMLGAQAGGPGAVHAADRSFNNHWGVPLTLARMPADTEWAVLEIGMNHAGEITPLTRLARPHVALITTVEAVHLEFFDSVAGIAEAKAEILSGLEPGGIAVLPADNAHLDRLRAAAPGPVRLFGTDPGAEVHLSEVVVGWEATALRVGVDGQPVLMRLAAPGRHLGINACAALAAAHAAGADPARAALGLGAWRPVSGRGVRETVALGPMGLDGHVTVIDESFNASPASVRAALEVLGHAPAAPDARPDTRPGRRLAFLGDMLELGESAAALHAGLAEAPEIAGADVVHCCGPLMRALHEALEPGRRGVWAPDSGALAARVGQLVAPGDTCMVKGSKGSRMGPVVEAVRALGTPLPAGPAASGAPVPA